MRGPRANARVKPSGRKVGILARRAAFKARVKTAVKACTPKAQVKRAEQEVVNKTNEYNEALATPADSTTDASDADDSSPNTKSAASSESSDDGGADDNSVDVDEEENEEKVVASTPSADKTARSSVFVYDMTKDGSLSSGMSFADCEAIQPSLRRQLDFLKFTKMTNVQAEAIPALITSTKDALIRSETGSGKTLAFLVPAINNILRAEATKRKAMVAAGILSETDARTPVFARGDGTRVIVISPTRELAVQTVETAEKLTQAWPWITTAALVSGTKRKSEKASLRKGITILITTPGRMLDHLETTNSFDSRRLSSLILDEVDRLLDLGFESKLRRIISELKENMKTTKLMRSQVAALAAGEECEKLIVDKDMFEAQRQAQREIARALLRESKKNPLQKTGMTPKIYDEDSDDAEIIEKSVHAEPQTQGTIIDMSDDEDAQKVTDSSAIVKPSLKEEKKVTPRLLNAADAAKFEADRDTFQVVIVSATLNAEIEKLARFCLTKNAVWILGKDVRDATPSTGVEETSTPLEVQDQQTKWDIPKSLKQAYIKLTTPKQRLLVLMSLLMMRIPKKKRTIVFVNNCEAVEFLHAFCEAVKWPNPPDNLKRKRPGDFDGRKETAKIREKARKMLTEVDDVLFQMSEDEAETNVENSKNSLFTSQRVLEGLKAYRLHGSMSRDDRVGNLGDFNHCREAAVIFVTDVAARGLNMPEVDLVIHLDAPVEVSDYVHRIGRTARMGTQGTSVLFLNEHETGYVKVLEAAGACPKKIKDSKEEVLLSMWAPPTARTTKVASFLPEQLRKLRASDAQNFLMSRFTMFVEDDAVLTDLAQKAYLSTVKTYRVYGESMRDHFDFGKLHLGHLAGSFLLRRSPNDIAASQQPQDGRAVSSRGRGRGDRQPGVSRGSFGGSSRGVEHRGGRGSSRATERGSFRGSDRGGFRGDRSRGALRGDRSRGGDRGGFRGGSSRGGARGSFREVRGGTFERGGRGGFRGGRGGRRGSPRGEGE